MSSLQDDLYNWLTIKVVTDERPDDGAAAETEKMFFDILTDSHDVSNLDIQKDDRMYYVSYDQKGERAMNRFPRELIEVMLNQIKNSPDKFKNYPDK